MKPGSEAHDQHVQPVLHPVQGVKRPQGVCCSCRTRYLSGVWFTAISTALIAVSCAILQQDHKAKGLQSPIQSLQGLSRTQPDPQYLQPNT